MSVQRTIWICLVMLVIRAAADVGIQAQNERGDNTAAVWVDDGFVQVWRSEPQASVTIPIDGRAGRVWLSPDGRKAVVQHSSIQDNGLGNQLSVIDVQSAAIRQTFSVMAPGNDDLILSAYQVAWADADMLYFNTVAVFPENVTPQNDLYRLDTTSGEVTAVLPPGMGGGFEISADGMRIAVARQGAYGAEQGTIAVLDVQTGQLREVLTFDSISSGSSLPFYPSMRWMAEPHELLVAIPHPDVLYYGDEPTVIWRIEGDGRATQVGQVSAMYYGQPQWSSDGAHMLFSQYSSDDRANASLFTAGSYGENPELYVTGSSGETGTARWIPNSERFTYYLDPAFRVGGIGDASRSIDTDSGANVVALKAIDESSFLVLTEENGQYRLWLRGAEGEPSTPLGIITSFIGGDEQWDAVSVPTG